MAKTYQSIVALHKTSDTTSTVPRAKRPDATLNLCLDSQDRFVECGIRSLRRGTVLMGSYGLAKLDSLCKAINNSPMIIFPRGAQSRF